MCAGRPGAGLPPFSSTTETARNLRVGRLHVQKIQTASTRVLVVDVCWDCGGRAKADAGAETSRRELRGQRHAWTWSLRSSLCSPCHWPSQRPQYPAGTIDRHSSTMAIAPLRPPSPSTGDGLDRKEDDFGTETWPEERGRATMCDPRRRPIRTQADTRRRSFLHRSGAAAGITCTRVPVLKTLQLPRQWSTISGLASSLQSHISTLTLYWPSARRTRGETA